jgi:hypothetical protein
MMSACPDVDLLKQLLALISQDATHEYVCRTSLVELVINEGERLGSPRDAVCFRLVGRHLPFDEPLEDGETPVWIFKVRLGLLIDLHDFRLLRFLWLLSVDSDSRHVLVAGEHTVWY